MSGYLANFGIKNRVIGDITVKQSIDGGFHVQGVALAALPYPQNDNVDYDASPISFLRQAPTWFAFQFTSCKFHFRL